MTGPWSHRMARACALVGGLVCLLTFAFPLSSFALPASPQAASQAPGKDHALIYGTVWGPDNHPVARIPIKIRRGTDKKAKWELVSDRNGEFAQRVPAGADDYIIEADVKTPKGQPKPQTRVHIDDNERKDVSVHLSR